MSHMQAAIPGEDRVEVGGVSNPPRPPSVGPLLVKIFMGGQRCVRPESLVRSPGSAAQLLAAFCLPDIIRRSDCA
jgi:hypothetical protein